MNTDLSDEALIILYAEGDVTAFYTLYERHKIKLYCFLYNLTNKQEALTNDLFQATWEIIIAKKNYLAGLAKADKLHFAKYLYTIARNKMMDYYRKSSRQPTLSFDELSDNGNQQPSLQVESKNPLPLEQIQQNEHSTLLLEAINSLPDEQRVVIIQHGLGDTFKEIAHDLKVSENTIKSRHRYGLKKLLKLQKVQKLLNQGGDHE